MQIINEITIEITNPYNPMNVDEISVDTVSPILQGRLEVKWQYLQELQ